MFEEKDAYNEISDEMSMPEEEYDETIVDECETTDELPDAECENAESVADNALDCFGWKNAKIEKWLVVCAKLWYAIMSFGWFLFSVVTFAPVIFISQKIDVLFRNRKKSMLVAIAVYCAIIVSIILIFTFRKRHTV